MNNYKNNKMTLKEFRTAINESMNRIIKEDREKILNGSSIEEIVNSYSEAIRYAERSGFFTNLKKIREIYQDAAAQAIIRIVRQNIYRLRISVVEKEIFRLTGEILTTCHNYPFLSQISELLEEITSVLEEKTIPRIKQYLEQYGSKVAESDDADEITRIYNEINALFSFLPEEIIAEPKKIMSGKTKEKIIDIIHQIEKCSDTSNIITMCEKIKKLKRLLSHADVLAVSTLLDDAINIKVQQIIDQINSSEYYSKINSLNADGTRLISFVSSSSQNKMRDKLKLAKTNGEQKIESEEAICRLIDEIIEKIKNGDIYRSRYINDDENNIINIFFEVKGHINDLHIESFI